MADNLRGKYSEDQNNDERQRTVQINSLDYLVSVDRLPILESKSGAQGIYHYGFDNNYPRKITQSSERSSKLVSSKLTLAEFIQGLGFPGANSEDVKNGTALVINRDGETAYDLLKFCADQKSNINIAIHVNYNALGEAVEFNMVDYPFVRRKVKQAEDKYIKYIITDIWHLESNYKYNHGHNAVMMEFNQWMSDKETKVNFSALECFDYNPDPIVVREQIELAGGIDNYPGQLFYMKRTRDIYQKALYDSVADDFQFLAETKLSSLSNIQNGYSAGGIFKYFGQANNTKALEEVKKKLENARGSKNFGRILTIEIPQGMDNMPNNLFESTQLQNIDKLYTTQKEDARNNIQELFRQPSALLGKESKGNLAIQDHEDAFKIYNGRTEQLRQEMEIELTTLFANSIFAGKVKLPIEIEPLSFNVEETENNTQEEEEKVNKDTETETVEEGNNE